MTGTGNFGRRRQHGRSGWWLSAIALALLAALIAPCDGSLAVNRRVDPTPVMVAGAPSGWTRQPPLEVARAGLDVATVHGRILAIGGFDPAQEFLNSVETRWSKGNKTWRILTRMPTARSNIAAAQLGGAVYVAGGYAKGSALPSAVVEKFDPGRNSWAQIPNLPISRGHAGAAALGGLLYVAGGFVPSGPAAEVATDSVVAYDPAKRRWKSVASMGTARARLKLVAAGGYLYAIGGHPNNFTTLSTVERYDARSNTWTPVASMNQDRGLPGAVTVTRGHQRLIVVVGGCQLVDGAVTVVRRSAEVYNVATGRWRLLQAQLPRGRCGLGAGVTSDGTILAIGGFTSVGPLVVTADVHGLKLERTG